MTPSFTLGVEEEYFLVDRSSGHIVVDPPPAVIADCLAQAPGQISPELLRCQIEVGTRVCHSVAEVRTQLGELRRIVAAVASEHDIAPIAASTHPFADWRPQTTTNRDRYQALTRDLGTTARRMMIGGMHVHVGIDDDDLRVDLMNQARYFLPHLLVLSTSSPFWQGQETGLKSYRLSVWNEVPRTGIPEEFGSYSEYHRNLQALVTTGVIEDATKIWWDLRPSVRFPTLEMRITDICTRLDDCMAVTALFVSVLRMLFRLRQSNIRWRAYKSLLIEENRWRAQRYGFDEGLLDFGKTAIVPYAELLEELIDLVREDAHVLGCLAEVESSRDILRRGTSAHHQLAVFRAAINTGADHAEALRQVVTWLVEETVRGVVPAPTSAAVPVEAIA